MTLVWSFNPQVESLLIHLSHEIHDTTMSLENLKLWMILVVSGLLTILYFHDVDD